MLEHGGFDQQSIGGVGVVCESLGNFASGFQSVGVHGDGPVHPGDGILVSPGPETGAAELDESTPFSGAGLGESRHHLYSLEWESGFYKQWRKFRSMAWIFSDQRYGPFCERTQVFPRTSGDPNFGDVAQRSNGLRLAFLCPMKHFPSLGPIPLNQELRPSEEDVCIGVAWFYGLCSGIHGPGLFHLALAKENVS
jgi:hypothetical protein